MASAREQGSRGRNMKLERKQHKDLMVDGIDHEHVDDVANNADWSQWWLTEGEAPASEATQCLNPNPPKRFKKGKGRLQPTVHEEGSMDCNDMEHDGKVDEDESGAGDGTRAENGKGTLASRVRRANVHGKKQVTSANAKAYEDAHDKGTEKAKGEVERPVS